MERPKKGKVVKRKPTKLPLPKPKKKHKQKQHNGIASSSTAEEGKKRKRVEHAEQSKRSRLQADDVPALRDDRAAPLQAKAARPPPLKAITDANAPAPLDRSGSSVGVELQALAMSDKNTIWNACASGDLPRLKEMVSRDPDVAWERGFVGETPMHLCCLLQKHDLAYWLIDNDPTVAVARYEGEPYDGENCLHIAVVNKDHGMAVKLAQRFPKLLRQAATGAFFSDEAELTPGGEHTPCYYGEYALHFAAATDQPELFDALLNLDPEALYLTDSNGNTILHLCTIHERPKMYDHVCKRLEDAGLRMGEELWQVHNKADQTPLVLAAHRGSRVMFEHILERSKKVQWSYGPVTCLIYPLSDFDLIPGAPQGALEAIVNCEHTKLLEIPRVVDLLRKKWESFGKRIFLRKFLGTLFFMMLFSCCTVCRTLDVHYATVMRTRMAAGELGLLFFSAQSCLTRALQADWDAAQTCLLALGDVLVLVGACSKLRRELCELRQEGFKGYFGCSGAAFLENFCSLFFCLGVVLTLILRCGLGSQSDESAVLCVISVVGWMYMLFFLLGHPTTGPIVVMMHKMFMQDVLLFMLIYGVFLLGFAQAFFVEFEEQGWSAFAGRIKSCFSTMLGEINFDEYSQSQHPALSTALVTIYIVAISVMLLNLLIAMMGDTYTKIVDDSRMIWQLERARILFSIETEMTPQERINNLAGYQMDIEGKKYVQVYKVDHGHFEHVWCQHDILLHRCKICCELAIK